MRYSSKLQAIVDKLRLTLESDHFIIRFGLRNPERGKGLGSGGVRDEALLRCYRDALERLYSVMTSPPLNYKPLKVASEGKTLVYVFEISDLFPGKDDPFMSVDMDGIPYICLPCRSCEPTTGAELQLAAVRAVHEATHVFNCTKRSLRDPNYGPWAWVDEAMAVFMETLVLPGNPDPLRFLMNWSDRPEVSLDSWAGRYGASMFLRHLVKRVDLGFISKWWNDSEETESPPEALVRLLQDEGQEFSSADLDVPDIFASGYCTDSYFPSGRSSDGFAQKVYERYGGRAISESFVLGPGDHEETTGNLDHLACRYYRFYVREDVGALQVRLETESQGDVGPLNAEIATVTTEMRRGIVKPLRPATADGPAGSVQLSAELAELDRNEVDHLILVVSNCGQTSADDGQQYTLDVRAISAFE